MVDVPVKLDVANGCGDPAGDATVSFEVPPKKRAEKVRFHDSIYDVEQRRKKRASIMVTMPGDKHVGSTKIRSSSSKNLSSLSERCTSKKEDKCTDSSTFIKSVLKRHHFDDMGANKQDQKLLRRRSSESPKVLNNRTQNSSPSSSKINTSNVQNSEAQKHRRTKSSSLLTSKRESLDKNSSRSKSILKDRSNHTSSSSSKNMIKTSHDLSKSRKRENPDDVISLKMRASASQSSVVNTANTRRRRKCPSTSRKSTEPTSIVDFSFLD